MTRVPGAPIDSTSLRPTPSDDSAPASSATGEWSGAVEYHGTRFYYGQPNAGQIDRGSLLARQLAKIAARLATLKRRLATRRQRRGVRGSGGGDDDFDDDLLDDMHDEHLRAEAGGGAGGGDSGSGGQSQHDEHGGSWSGDSAHKLDIKALDMRPVQEPPPGALAARIAAQDSDAVSQEQLAEDWCAGLVSRRNKLAADPGYKPDVEHFDAMLDLIHAKQRLGSLKPRGAAFWREMLKTRLAAHPVKTPVAATAQANSGTVAVPASRRELTPLETCHALLLLEALAFDAPYVSSRTERSVNTVTTQRNALVARHSKR